MFYKYTYTETVLTEQKEEIEETVTLIYLVLYKNMLKYDYKLLFGGFCPPTTEITTQEIKQEQVKQEPNQEQVTQDLDNVTEKLSCIELKSELGIKERFQECTKVTIPVLKSFLKELDLKTTGSKNELTERLNEALKNF